jgi:hypothetical protein
MVSAEPVNESTILDQLSTPLLRDARPVRISRSQGRINHANKETMQHGSSYSLLVSLKALSIAALNSLYNLWSITFLAAMSVSLKLSLEVTVNCQRFDRRDVPREDESWETATDFTEDLAPVGVGVVNGRVRNRSVPGGGAMVCGIGAVTGLRARVPRALASLPRLCRCCVAVRFSVGITLAGMLAPLARRFRAANFAVHCLNGILYIRFCLPLHQLVSVGDAGHCRAALPHPQRGPRFHQLGELGTRERVGGSGRRILRRVL